MSEKFDGQSIQDMQKWIEDNPTKFDGIIERYRKIKEMENNPYAHYYGWNKPID